VALNKIMKRIENSKNIETHLDVELRVEAMQNLDFIVAKGGRASIGYEGIINVLLSFETISSSLSVLN
jgi:hypothetical protein